MSAPTPILELTRDQIVEKLEHGARARLGLSAEELIRRYRAGELKDCGQIADLLSLAHLLDEDDPLFVSA